MSNELGEEELEAKSEREGKREKDSRWRNRQTREIISALRRLEFIGFANKK